MSSFKIKVSDRFAAMSEKDKRRMLMAFRFVELADTSDPLEPNVEVLDGGVASQTYYDAVQGGVANTTFTNTLNGGTAPIVFG